MKKYLQMILHPNKFIMSPFSQTFQLFHKRNFTVFLKFEGFIQILLLLVRKRRLKLMKITIRESSEQFSLFLLDKFMEVSPTGKQDVGQQKSCLVIERTNCDTWIIFKSTAFWVKIEFFSLTISLQITGRVIAKNIKDYNVFQ